MGLRDFFRRSVPAGPGSSASPGADPLAPSRSPATVLIASDAIARQLAAELRASRGAVEVCGDRDEAFSYLDRFTPKAIVLGVELDRGSGYSLCNELRKDPRLEACPLVLFSMQRGAADAFAQHTRLKTAADQYVSQATAALLLEALQDAEAGAAVRVRGG